MQIFRYDLIFSSFFAFSLSIALPIADKGLVDSSGSIALLFGVLVQAVLHPRYLFLLFFNSI